MTAPDPAKLEGEPVYRIVPCRSCGASMVWGKNAVTGKTVPLDAKPERRYVAAGRDAAGNPAFRLEFTYLSHFITCPNAAQHRKRK